MNDLQFYIKKYGQPTDNTISDYRYFICSRKKRVKHMKINETGRVGAVNSYQKQNGQHINATNKKKQTDQVQISSEAKELQSMNLAQSSERAAKLNSLKQQVQTGTYRVEAGKIAEKLLPYLKQ